MCTNILLTLTLHNQPPVIIVAKHQIITLMSPARGDRKVISLISDGKVFFHKKCQDTVKFSKNYQVFFL